MYVLLLCVLSSQAVRGQLTEKSYHTTKHATEKGHNLTCFHCNTLLEGGEQCAELQHDNASNFPENLIRKCPPEMRTCIVKRFSYTTSTENTTSVLRMWSLERNCSNHCDPGCIVIGERTKLYACTACCDTSHCNTGKGNASDVKSSYILAAILFSTTLFFNLFS